MPEIFPILNQIYSLHILPPYLFHIPFNIIHKPMPRFPKDPYDFPNQMLNIIITWPRLSHSPWSENPDHIFRQELEKV
jgi:hypothetical protein